MKCISITDFHICFYEFFNASLNKISIRNMHITIFDIKGGGGINKHDFFKLSSNFNVVFWQSVSHYVLLIGHTFFGAILFEKGVNILKCCIF
jgi:hypothetical protein